MTIAETRQRLAQFECIQKTGSGLVKTAKSEQTGKQNNKLDIAREYAQYCMDSKVFPRVPERTEVTNTRQDTVQPFPQLCLTTASTRRATYAYSRPTA